MRKTILALGAAVLLAVASVGSVAAGGGGGASQCSDSDASNAPGLFTAINAQNGPGLEGGIAPGESLACNPGFGAP
jgi:hypothetical protein